MSKDKTTAIVWTFTILLVVAMLGVAVYIGMSRKTAGTERQQAEQSVTQSEKRVDITHSPHKTHPQPQTQAVIPQQPEEAAPQSPASLDRYKAAELVSPASPLSASGKMLQPPRPMTDEQKREAAINRMAAQKRDRVIKDAEIDLSGLANNMTVDMKLVGTKKNKFPLRHTCYRNNVSPPLRWGNVPAGTRSFIVFMDRIDDGDETPVPYWILFNIPSDRTSLPEDVTALPSGNMRFGANDFDKPEYTGPCDPKGKHKYRIRVFALDTALGLSVGASRANVIRAMDGHVLDVGELTALHYM